jgi:hypothetical protein
MPSSDPLISPARPSWPAFRLTNVPPDRSCLAFPPQYGLQSFPLPPLAQGLHAGATETPDSMTAEVCHD